MMGKECLIYFACFIIEFSKYIYGIRTLFNEQFKRHYLIPIAMIIYFLSFIDFSMTEILLVMYICVYLTIFFMIDVSIKRRIIICFLMLACINCLDEMFSIVLMMIFRLPDNILTLISSLICLVSILFIGFIKRQISYKKIALYKFIQRKVYILVSIMAISALLVNSFLNVISSEEKDIFLKNLAAIISIISIVSLLIIIIFFVYLLKINEWMEQYAKNERKLQVTQSMYYEALLDKEYDTRKYRHDILNHYISMEGYLKLHEYDKAESYLQALKNEIENIHERVYLSGNHVIDSLLNYYVSLLDENVDIEIKAKCNQKVCICDTDLCVIVGNLLQNAIESLLREDNDSPLLKIEILQKDINIFITIQNSVPAGYEQEIKKYVTKKGDERNHGIGIKNVIDCLKRYDGELEQYCKEGLYNSKVYVKYL